jgi:3-methylcrotonyl-CoA carboxylase alpha subunit
MADRALEVKVLAWDGVELTLLVGDRVVRGAVERRGPRLLVHYRGVVWAFDEGGGLARSHGAAASSELVAPMTGTVVQVFATEGQAVDAGVPLVIVEAMKMEHRIVAPAKGRVARVHVKSGEQVDVGAQLVSLELDGAP